ncbi:hypothetical protein BDW74DRAFT_187690 [Aspergillus multicolor]|uniref:uncharacterized protein n=1 Tax=Aspergillus multicolor TaxID=41759 RepID=UPI003CCE3673
MLLSSPIKRKPGFCLVVSGIVPDEAFVLVEKDALDCLANPELPKYLTSANCREKWWQLMKHGFNLDVLILLQHFGTTQGGIIWQGPIIHNLAPGSTSTRLRRAHPCCEGVSIWRPVRGGLGPENGLFKVYPASHKIKTEDELRNSEINAVKIRLRADQVLIACGGLWIEEGSGNSLLIWIGLSADIIGLHINKYCLPFVAFAHGAERFLSRHQPPEIEPMLAPNAIFPVMREKGASTSLSNEITRFIEKLWDPTDLIFCAANNQIMTSLAVGRSTSPKRLLLSVLVARYLTCWCLSSGETIKDFVKAKDLPDNAYKAIFTGHKLYWLEEEFKEPGIWLVLMGVFTQLTHLPARELSSIPHLIREYAGILETALKMSWLVNACTQLYRHLMSINCG